MRRPSRSDVRDACISMMIDGRSAAVERMPPSLRSVLEARYSQPDLSAFDRPAAAGLCHTRYHAALAAGRAFIEGFLSAGQEGDQATG